MHAQKALSEPGRKTDWGFVAVQGWAHVSFLVWFQRPAGTEVGIARAFLPVCSDVGQEDEGASKLSANSQYMESASTSQLPN